MILTGDVNLLSVTDPQVPFRRVAETLKTADVVFGNLECCLFDAPEVRPEEGFYVPIAAGPALSHAGYAAVGTANNVNFGRHAILSSLAQLDQMGIAHTGSGANLAAARAPAIVERDGLRYGFLQRTCVYWAHGHEAGESSAGVAAVRTITAYRPQIESNRTLTRAGMPPEILTWTDPAYLATFRDDVAALRKQADVVVVSVHWGLEAEVLAYQAELAHAAVDAGADAVMGHGPHVALGMEVYRDKPIFYGMGNFSFNVGHWERKHGDWLGLLARIDLRQDRVAKVSCVPVRHSRANETLLRTVAEERAEMEVLVARSAKLGTELRLTDAEAVLWEG